MRTCLIIAGVLTGVLLLLALAGYLGFRALMRPRHKAMVNLGSALPWRTLESRKRSFGFMDLANLDADPEAEIVVFRPDLIAFELSGAKVGFTAPPNPEEVMFCWDYDRDGIDDFIVNEFQITGSGQANAKQQGLTDHMVAYSVRGHLLGKIAGHQMGPQSIICDMDGDGKADLFMSEEGDYGPDPSKGVRAFGKDGQIVFSAGPDFNSPYLIAGDVDGNGKDEIIDTFSGRYLEFSGSVKQLNFGAEHQWCLDINGDGRDELIGRDGSVTDLATGSVIQMRPPPGFSGINLEGQFSGNIASVEFKGRPCITAAIGANPLTAEGIAIWDPTGVPVYSESFGEKVEVLRVARGAQGDVLVVLTDQRLLVWP